MSNTTQQMNAPETAIMPSTAAHSASDSIKPPPSALQSKKSSGNEGTNNKKSASQDEGGQTTAATSKSSKRSTRSSTRDSTSSVATKKRSRGSDEAANRARPKRRAASSVRFGSYKEVENVDFSLIEHFNFNDGASPGRSSKKKSPIKSSASVVSSKKQSPASLKRSALLVSAQSSLNLAESEPSSAAAPPASKIFEMSKQKTAKKISGSALERLLPPVLLSRSKDGYAAIPKFLQRLKSSNGKVEIFNRKTGKILKGSQSVSLKRLASELQAHSEYEPICPEYSRTSSPSSPIYRQARTSATARVSEQIQPQSRLRAFKDVGRTVLITGGSHKGLFGIIDSCIPGNWYVLSNVFKDDPLELDIVVHSRDLKLVNGGTKEATRNNTGSSAETESAKDELEKAATESYAKPVTKTIEALGLRVDALEEQKIKFIGTLASISVGQEGPSLPPAASNQGQELQRITQRITKAKSELQKYKLVRNVLVGRGLNGKSRTK